MLTGLDVLLSYYNIDLKKSDKSAKFLQPATQEAQKSNGHNPLFLFFSSYMPFFISGAVYEFRTTAPFFNYCTALNNSFN